MFQKRVISKILFFVSVCGAASFGGGGGPAGDGLVFRGAGDASAAAAISEDMFVVAHDENNVLRVYQTSRAGMPVFSYDLTAFLGIEDEHPEADIEGATMIGQRIYWITSHGRNKDGKMRPNRYRFFATEVRVITGNTWSAMKEATFAVGPQAANLRITEIMYHPPGPREEFIELKNIGTETIDLNLVSFTNGIDFTFPSIDLGAGESILVVRDREDFEARYGTTISVAGEYSGKVSNAGERIRLQDALGQTIQDFDYKDGWRSITDGQGFSLTAIDPANPDPDAWNEKGFWRASSYRGGSPGRDDSSNIPNPGAVVINELLAHSHDEASDWIELYNTTGTAIDVGGWFLSDSKDYPAKYEIADGTVLGPNGYLVLYQNLNFDNTNDPGCHQPFALSENGEQLYL
ncbi:MAG: lamin tail domain-containing protein, partial [Desulfobacteraceae bacterium]|nr:lamin tail domain-containing protein [Desulfobacteraceae bacterium]